MGDMLHFIQEIQINTNQEYDIRNILKPISSE